MKSPYSIKQIENSLSKEALIARAVTDLIRIHKQLLEKIDYLEKNVSKQRGPSGHTPTKTELLQLIQPVVYKYLGDQNLQGIVGSLITQPKDGETPSKEQLEALIKPIVSEYTANLSEVITKKDLKKLVDLIVSQIKLPEYKIVDEEEIVGSIKSKKKIKAGDIDGLEQTLSAMRTQLSRGYLHGSGVPSLTAGSNITLTPKADGGFTISSTGGSGTTILEPTSGAINDTNTQFVFSQKPNIIVVNGSQYRENKGWTWNAGTTTATLSSPVGTGGDIYALI